MRGTRGHSQPGASTPVMPNGVSLRFSARMVSRPKENPALTGSSSWHKVLLAKESTVKCTPTVRHQSPLERNTCQTQGSPIGSPADNSDESRAVARKAEGARNKGHRQAGSDQAGPTADAKQRTARAAHVERGQASKDWEHHITPDVGDTENPGIPIRERQP